MHIQLDHCQENQTWANGLERGDVGDTAGVPGEEPVVNKAGLRSPGNHLSTKVAGSKH